MPIQESTGGSNRKGFDVSFPAYYPSDVPSAPRPRVIGDKSLDWRDPHGRRWIVRTTWAEVEGRAEVIGIELRSHLGTRWGERGTSSYVVDVPAEGATPLTASIWRALNVGDIIQKQRKGQTRNLERVVGLPSDRAEKWGEDLVAFRAPASKRGGRPPLEPQHFVEVAGIYLETWRKGDSPTKAVANHFGVAQSTAAKWVMRAREMDLLGQTTPGKAGGGSPKRRRRK